MRTRKRADAYVRMYARVSVSPLVPMISRRRAIARKGCRVTRSFDFATNARAGSSSKLSQRDTLLSVLCLCTARRFRARPLPPSRPPPLSSAVGSHLNTARDRRRDEMSRRKARKFGCSAKFRDKTRVPFGRSSLEVSMARFRTRITGGRKFCESYTEGIL